MSLLHQVSGTLNPAEQAFRYRTRTPEEHAVRAAHWHLELERRERVRNQDEAQPTTESRPTTTRAAVTPHSEDSAADGVEADMPVSKQNQPAPEDSDAITPAPEPPTRISGDSTPRPEIHELRTSKITQEEYERIIGKPHTNEVTDRDLQRLMKKKNGSTWQQLGRIGQTIVLVPAGFFVACLIGVVIWLCVSYA